MAGIDWKGVIALLGGNAIFLAAAAWLMKTIVSDRLAREAEAFKIQVQTAADIEIERIKAYLARASHVHEQQIEALRSSTVTFPRLSAISSVWLQVAI